jgi:ribokinase
MACKITVVGSFVYDLVVWLPYFPRQGETLLASEFKMYAGGKGFNQAVTARRCGALVGMAGKVGADQFGAAFMELLNQEGIDHRFVIQDHTITTSLGIPMINPQGENSIIGVPRANTRLTTTEVEAASQMIAESQVLLLQLEIPLEVTLHAAQLAHRAGVPVLLNPAPAAFPLEVLLPRGEDSQPLVDWLLPNEVEAEMLSGIKITNLDEAILAGKAILSNGVRQGVIITLGSRGVVAVTAENYWYNPAFHVTPIDPTGAGDAFCGAFAFAFAEGQTIPQALRFANAAGALAVTVAGAEPSLPRRESIEAFLDTQQAKE